MSPLKLVDKKSFYFLGLLRLLIFDKLILKKQTLSDDDLRINDIINFFSNICGSLHLYKITSETGDRLLIDLFKFNCTNMKIV